MDPPMECPHFVVACSTVAFRVAVARDHLESCRTDERCMDTGLMVVNEPPDSPRAEKKGKGVDDLQSLHFIGGDRVRSVGVRNGE